MTVGVGLKGKDSIVLATDSRLSVLKEEEFHPIDGDLPPEKESSYNVSLEKTIITQNIESVFQVEFDPLSSPRPTVLALICLHFSSFRSIRFFKIVD